MNCAYISSGTAEEECMLLYAARQEQTAADIRHSNSPVFILSPMLKAPFISGRKFCQMQYLPVMENYTQLFAYAKTGYNCRRCVVRGCPNLP